MADLTPYVVAVFAMLFSGCSALILIATISHLDPPEVEQRSPVSV